MPSDLAVSVDGIVHRYGVREALRGVSFGVACGEIFGLLGPNGGGKTTLFRILCTSLKPVDGRAQVFGYDVVADPSQVRRMMGVVFQSPSLDKKLTAAENLMHHGHLFGLRGPELQQQMTHMLQRVGLEDRAADRVEHLSGGMQRRLEVAKGLLHRPRLMLMDEPSTGLDPARAETFGDYLKQVRDQQQLTILLTTHLMDEAEQCDRVAILNHGELVALGTPGELAAEVGHQVISLEAKDPQQLADRIQTTLGLSCSVLDNTVRIGHERGHELIAKLFDSFADDIRSVTVRHPSLEDVFIRKTGHRFWNEGEPQIGN